MINVIIFFPIAFVQHLVKHCSSPSIQHHHLTMQTYIPNIFLKFIHLPIFPFGHTKRYFRRNLRCTMKPGDWAVLNTPKVNYLPLVE